MHLSHKFHLHPIEKICRQGGCFLHISVEFEDVAFGRFSLFFYSILAYYRNFNSFAEEETPSKVAKVDTASTPLVGAIVPGSLGIGYPHRPALGVMQPMYVLIRFSPELFFGCIWYVVKLIFAFSLDHLVALNTFFMWISPFVLVLIFLGSALATVTTLQYRCLLLLGKSLLVPSLGTHSIRPFQFLLPHWVMHNSHCFPCRI